MAEKGEDKKSVVVVVAVDGSEHSEYALKWYSEVLYNSSHDVNAVYCVEYKPLDHHGTSAMSGENTFVAKQIEEQEEETNALVDEVAKELQSLKLEGRVDKMYGEDPAHAIIHYARDKNADFIVMGSRGKGKLKRTFTGSITDHVVHKSNIPVMVCRHKDFHPHHHHFPKLFHHKKHESKDTS